MTARELGHGAYFFECVSREYMMDAIVSFLDVRDCLSFAGVCARTRECSRDLARMCAVLRDAMKGGARAVQINVWINCTQCMISLCESRELSMEVLMERVLVYADIDGGVPVLSDFVRASGAIGTRRCSLDTGLHIRGDFSRYLMMHDPALVTICAMIIAGAATRAHYSRVATITVNDAGAAMCRECLYAALRDVHAGPGVTEFFECLCDGEEIISDEQRSRAMQHLPFTLATMRAVFGSVRDVIGLFDDTVLHMKIGPKLAGCLLDVYCAPSIIAQAPADSREFSRCFDVCVDLIKRCDSARDTAWLANAVVACAAKNEDERALDLMLALVADTEYASREYKIDWKPSDGYDILSRTILRLETRGLTAKVAIPDYKWYSFASVEEAARCFEMIFARLDKATPSRRAIELYGVEVLRVYHLNVRCDMARLRKLRALVWHQCGPAIDEYCARMM